MDLKFYNPSAAGRPDQPVNRSLGFLFIPVLVIVLICGFSSFWLRFPAILYPNTIQGKYMDLSPNPDGTVWILTDGSLRYLFTETRPGHTSTGVRGKFCKTFLYHYDPVKKKVLKKITTKYEQLPNHCYLFRLKDRLWQVGRMPREPWILDQYDAATGGLRFDAAKLIAQHPELKPGLAGLQYFSDPDRARLKSKVGLKYVFLLADELLLPDQYAPVKDKIIDHYFRQGLASLVVLVGEGKASSERKMIYRIDGSASALVSELLWPFNGLDNTLSLTTFNDASFNEMFRVTPLIPGEVYLNPLIIYQDNELAVVLSQDQVGNEAERSLVCVNATGGIKWTVPPDQLFSELMARQSKPLSSIFFIKDKIKGERQENYFVLKVADLGAICFDVKTGQKLWAIRP